MFDLSRMQKIVDRMQKLQPPHPPPDNRFLPEELKKEKVVEEPTGNAKKNIKRQLIIKNQKSSNGQKPVEDEKLFLIQKENYLKKKQRELEMEQVKKELAEQRKQEKLKMEQETQRALYVVKEKKEYFYKINRITQIVKEEKIKKQNDDEFVRRKQKGINQSIQLSIDASYVSQSQNLNSTLIKKQIEDYHTLPREQYNRIYRQQAVSPPK